MSDEILFGALPKLVDDFKEGLLKLGLQPLFMVVAFQDAHGHVDAYVSEKQLPEYMHGLMLQMMGVAPRTIPQASLPGAGNTSVH